MIATNSLPIAIILASILTRTGYTRLMGIFIRQRAALVFLLAVALLSAIGCRSAYDAAYYRTMEAFGQEKRDILVDQVDDARASQEQAKEQFSSALEQFSALMDFDGGELETLYNRLQTEFERSETRAAQVSEEVDDVERVARALFREWEDELDAYTDQNLRQVSERQLEETQAQYQQLVGAMYRAEEKMAPVLDAFRDQVLFLKHNLNARAIASLEGAVASLESDVAVLIAEMEASIEEANRFIDQMRASAS